MRLGKESAALCPIFEAEASSQRALDVPGSYRQTLQPHPRLRVVIPSYQRTLRLNTAGSFTMHALRLAIVLTAILISASVIAAGRVDIETRSATANGASARVLVMLHEAPPSLRSQESLEDRVTRIQTEVDAVLSSLPASAYTLRRRFLSVPGFAIDTDRAGLDRLDLDARVHSVGLDVGGGGSGTVAPDIASVLNQVSPLQAMGLNGSGMKIAVIDSGIDTDHVDFAGRIVAQQCFCAGVAGSVGCCPNGLDTQSGAGSAEDNHGHGTNVSGIILGAGDVAPRGALPAASLVSVKVLDANNSFCCASDVIAAIDWVRVNHPDVDAVNLSLGTGTLFTGDCDASPAFNVAMSTAVNSLRGVGATVTASSGNQASNTSSSSPACIASTLSVGATWDSNVGSATILGCTDATTAAKQITCFSNLGGNLDVIAAGAFVTSTGFNGATSTFAGTSQAAPMVAACAAALKQANPAATMNQIEALIEAAPTTVSTPRNGSIAYPFLDCVAAVQALLLFANGFE
jgi:subtilisin family serine protease